MGVVCSSLDMIFDDCVFKKLSSIQGNSSHPLHDYFSSSSKRLNSIYCRNIYVWNKMHTVIKEKLSMYSRTSFIRMPWEISNEFVIVRGFRLTEY